MKTVLGYKFGPEHFVILTIEYKTLPKGWLVWSEKKVVFYGTHKSIIKQFAQWTRTIPQLHGKLRYLITLQTCKKALIR